MITFDLTCVGFMDSDPIGHSSVQVHLEVTPRFFIPPQNRPAEPDEPDLDDLEARLYADATQAVVLEETSVTDANGRVQVHFDCDDAWQAVGRRTHPTLGRTRDVVGFMSTQLDVASMDLVGRHGLLLARSPNGTVEATVIVDPAKLVIGHTTASTARVLCWLHAAPLPGFRFAVVRNGGTGVDRRAVAISRDSAHVGSVEYRDLEPDTHYTLSLLAQSRADRSIQLELARGEFQTRPQAPTRWTIDFASCHQPTDNAALRPWTLEANRDPADLLILLGDQIYGDAVPDLTPDSWPWLRRYTYRYEQLWAYQPMRRVLRSTPTVAIFDDHEVIDDWGVATVDEIGASRLSGALAAYRSFQDNLNPTPRPRNQFDFGLVDGRVAIYVLDLRSRRGGGGVTNVLGAEQLARFRSWCRSPSTRSADVILLASSVPLAYLPTEELEDLAGDAAEVTGGLLGALAGGLFFGPVGAIVGAYVGAEGSAIAYDDYMEDIREPDLQDQWVHDRNQAELGEVLDELFDLAADVRGDPVSRRPRAVFVLSGDVHVGGIHLIHSNRSASGHDHRQNRLLYQLTSSPVSHEPAGGALLEAILDPIGANVDLRNAEFLRVDPDRSGGTLGTRRFVLDSNGGEHYAAEFLGVLPERNIGRLVVESLGQRRYRFLGSIDGRTDSLLLMFDLDLDAPQVQPVDLIGQVLRVDGTPVEVRVVDRGGYGPPSDHLDSEVVVRLDTAPGRAFGFQLRPDEREPAHSSMLDQLRHAFNHAVQIGLDYRRTGPRTGEILRVISFTSPPS